MSIWRGSKVYLRAFEPTDGDYNFESWNDFETLKYRDVPKFPASKQITSFYAHKDAEQGPIAAEAHLIIENLEGEIVGDIGTGQCDPKCGTFTFGLEIKKTHRRKGYAYEAILLVLRYYFFAQRYHKAWTSVYSFNEPSLALLNKLRFEKEGLQKEMSFLNGKYHDKVLFGMTEDRFTELYGNAYKI
jgi:RimJ/RimL family protein N-acetyltransferase